MILRFGIVVHRVIYLKICEYVSNDLITDINSCFVIVMVIVIQVLVVRALAHLIVLGIVNIMIH